MSILVALYNVGSDAVQENVDDVAKSLHLAISSNLLFCARRDDVKSVPHVCMCARGEQFLLKIIYQ